MKKNLRMLILVIMPGVIASASYNPFLNAPGRIQLEEDRNTMEMQVLPPPLPSRIPIRKLQQATAAPQSRRRLLPKPPVPKKQLPEYLFDDTDTEPDDSAPPPSYLILVSKVFLNTKPLEKEELFCIACIETEELIECDELKALEIIHQRSQR